MSEDEHVHADDQHVEEKNPEVYAVSMDPDGFQFSRRHFIELAAAATAVAAGTAACTDEDKATVKKAKPSRSTTTTSSTTTTTTLPPTPGTVPPGTEGAQYDIEGQTFNLPCGSPLPAGAVCTCDCVTTPSPPLCGCVGDTGCGCVGDTGVSSHYWYPN
jgi:hypothetical protein